LKAEGKVEAEVEVEWGPLSLQTSTCMQQVEARTAASGWVPGPCLTGVCWILELRGVPFSTGTLDSLARIFWPFSNIHLTANAVVLQSAALEGRKDSRLNIHFTYIFVISSAFV
jgi:hypothetical protein